MENKRPEISGRGIVVGMVVTKDGHAVVHTATKDLEHVVKQVIDLLVELGQIPANFEYSSLQLLFNASVAKHKDANIGVSLIVSFGSFSGGSFHHGDKVLNTYQCAQVIDGQVEHYVSNFKGTRWSIALYLHPRCKELKQSDKEFLAKVGFRLPEVSGGENRVSAVSRETRLELGDGRLHLLEIAVPLNVVASILAEKSRLAQHMSINEGADVLEVCAKQCPDANVIS